jgi:hypothetical protein
MYYSAINPQPVHSAALFCIEFACMLTIVPFDICVAVFMVSNQGSNVLSTEFWISVLFLNIILLFVAFVDFTTTLFNGKFTAPT